MKAMPRNRRVREGSANEWMGRIVSACVFGALPILAAAQAASASGDTAPAPAGSAGYVSHTFHSRFTAGSVDLQDERTANFQWFRGRFFGYPPLERSAVSLANGGEGVVLADSRRANYGIATAAPTRDGKGWVGIAFGGGAYIEAQLQLDPAASREAPQKGWPAFWGMAIEHLAALPGEQWPGQPKGYQRFIEVDIFEYDLTRFGLPDAWYGSAIHDWYGRYQATCTGGYCHHSTATPDVRMKPPPATDFNCFHTYGFLWIPATAHTPGRAQFFFDGKPIGKPTRWERHTDREPELEMKSAGFSVLDKNHLVLILGTGRTQPMTVRTVDVWQASPAANLVCGGAAADACGTN
ncbi:hypothetical protein B0G69_7952 [Paraburkholderia sp. RAU2J]|uniref:hypothetical protein n=1 Tax=Paraburkholderia sp. RAU2J TaxID=1938810 RepID=UPI000F28047A|nr:hypothetical protein [Paraburkholderia sp. RAU2J]RKT10525.1 hypothetical protein B0G69_7952 [Paraburkholderia sp. RAU2J]